MAFTLYFDQALLSQWFGSTPITPPSTYYLALSVTAPTAYEPGPTPWNFTEPVGGGYARIAIPKAQFVPISSEPATSYNLTNANDLAFPVSTGVWGNGALLSYGGLYDSADGGNLLGFGLLTPNNQTITGPGFIVRIPAGQFQIIQGG